jgi:hypothetical protein
MDGKVIRRTWPTASFSFAVEHLEWIEAEAKRRTEALRQAGEQQRIVSKSEVMRKLVDDARAAQEQQAA